MDNFTLAITVLLGMYCTALGMRQSHLSGFAFYRISGLAVGTVFFSSVIFPLTWWNYAMFLIIMVDFWQGWRGNKAREAHPAKWEAWQTIRDSAGCLGSLLLFPRSNRVKRDE